MEVVLFIGGWLLLIAIVVVTVHRSTRARTDAFKAIADEKGLGFFPDGDPALLERLREFYLFDRGRHPDIVNMIHGETDAAEVAVFGYHYLTGSGKNRTTTKQSVAYIRSPLLALPEFAIRPEGLFNKIGQVLGTQDIDFEGSPEFSKRYLVKSDDEAAVRRSLSDDFLRHVGEQKDLCLESRGDQFIMYRVGERVKPEDTRAFLEEAFALLRLLAT